MTTRWLLFASLATATSATASCGTEHVESEDMEADEIMIPDPGIQDADWGFSISGHSSPEMAHAVGVVSQSPGYIDGTLDEVSGDGFYVFQSGNELTSFSVNLVGGAAEIEYVHLHEGEGLVFGEEIVPTESAAASGTWTVEPGSTYVLEIHSVSGGFY